MAGRPPFDPGFDPELEEIFRREPELREVSRRLRASRPDPVLAPHFRTYLRARLMDAAAVELRPRGLRRLRPRAHVLAWAGAGLGVAMIGAVVATLLLSHPSDRVELVSANSQVDGRANVDPNDVIRISFTRPMDHNAVASGLRIQPATQVSTRWEGNTLVLTPVNKLSGNTPYTVTIAKDAARATDGTVAPADIHIAFGTHPTATPKPTPTPTGPPALAFHSLVPVDGNAQLLIASDGSLVASNAAPATVSSASPGPSPGETATPLPLSLSISPSPTPAAPAPGLVHIATDGTVTRLSDPVSGVALSKGDRSLALLGPAQGGKAPIEVADADGSHLTIVATTDDTSTPLAWGGDDLHPTVVYVASGSLHSVDLQGHVRTFAGRRAIPNGATVVLSADGTWAYIGPPAGTGSPATTPAASPSPSPTATNSTNPGVVVELATGNGHVLPSAGSAVAFSADGSRVFWVDTASGSLMSAPAAGGSSVTIPVPGAESGSSVDSLAANGNGARIAYVLHHANGTSELDVANAPAGTLLAVAPSQGLSHAVLSAAGDILAVVHSGAPPTADVAVLPGAVSTAPSSVPADASSLVTKLVDAQVSGTVSTLGSVVAPTASADLTTLTPPGLSRGYVVRIERSPGSATAVIANVRLVRDPNKVDSTLSPALSSDETLTVDKASPEAAYTLVAITATPLRPEPVGPQVVHIDSSGDSLSTVVRITFDSDLRSDTVAKSITVLDRAGKHLTASVSYDAASRVATVSVNGARPLTLSIAISLLDIEGQPLAAPYRTTVGS